MKPLFSNKGGVKNNIVIVKDNKMNDFFTNAVSALDIVGNRSLQVIGNRSLLTETKMKMGELKR